MKMATPGKTASHQANVVVLASCKIEPQVTSSAGTPIPRKLRLDSTRIAPAMPSTTETMTGAKAFGKICLNMTFRLLIPSKACDTDPTGCPNDRHGQKDARRQQRCHSDQ